MKNSFDPDLDQQNAESDLVPSCLLLDGIHGRFFFRIIFNIPVTFCQKPNRIYFVLRLAKFEECKVYSNSFH